MILLPVLFMLAAMAVNLAYMQTVKTKVQVVTDAAARAAGTTYATTGDEALALQSARAMASLNPIESMTVSISAADLEFGVSERQATNKSYVFTPAANGNSVRVTTNTFAGGAGTALRPVLPIYGQTMEIRPVCTATHTQTTLDVAVIVDRSGSMRYAADENSNSGSQPATASTWNAGDPSPPNSRWLDLVASVNLFCTELDSTGKIEKVALCSYASDSSTQTFLTEDYTQIAGALNVISSEFWGGMTAVGDGILEGLAAVSDRKWSRPWATNALVLMSDGNHNRGSDPIAAAQAALDAKVPIYTVSFSVEANRTLMQQIADMTGGRHYHAVDASQLNAAFRSIARSLPSIITE